MKNVLFDIKEADMKSIFFSSLLTSLLIIGCSGESGQSIFGASSLPDDPEKIVIEWSEGGGMLPEGQDIYISLDSSYYEMWHDQIDQKLYFNTTEEELDEIYQVFIENDFNGIRQIEEQEVYDRGGTSIRLVADGKYYDKNNSGMTFLHKNDVEEYYAIENKIYSFAKNKIEDQKVKTTVTISQDLLAKNYLLYINVNGAVVYNSDTDSLLTQKDTMLYKTMNGFELSIYDRDSLNYYGSPTYLKSFYLMKEISDTSNAVEFGITKEGDLTGK